MKRISLSVFFFLGCFSFHLAYANDGITLVSGVVNKENARSLILFEVIEGKRSEYASTKLGSDNSFAFALPIVKEGFYYISDQGRNSFIRIYLKTADRLALQINEDGYDVVTGSGENKLLHEWFTASYPITYPATNWMKDSSTYLSYFPKLEKFVRQLPAFKAKVKTKNKQFNRLLNLAIDTDVEFAAMHFLMVPNTVHPKKEQYPAFYHQIIQPNKYASADLLQLGEGVSILGSYITFNMLMNRSETKPENRLLSAVQLLANDTVKGAYIASSLRYKTFEELEKDIVPVKQYLVTDSMQSSYFRALKALATFKKGSPSYNFVYEDINGNKVGMNDLKGKVVLVDVWATWCGPCKVEIPHLKKLEEEFKGKNVVFVSISVDAPKDKEKWKSMVVKEQLGGTQLYAGTSSDLSKYYDINGIPRFMVFDQDGKIVSADSPRPSQPELRQLLENTLQEK